MLLLGTVQFLDVVDSSIVNVALPSIQHSLHFSQQNLQWVVSGYLREAQVGRSQELPMSRWAGRTTMRTAKCWSKVSLC